MDDECERMQFISLLCHVMESELVPSLMPSSLRPQLESSPGLRKPGAVTRFIHGDQRTADSEYSAACFLNAFGSDLHGYFDIVSAWRDVVRLYGVLVSMLDKLRGVDADSDISQEDRQRAEAMRQRLTLTISHVSKTAAIMEIDLGVREGKPLPVLDPRSDFADSASTGSTGMYIHRALHTYCDHYLHLAFPDAVSVESRHECMHRTLSNNACPRSFRAMDDLLAFLRQKDMSGPGMFEAFLFLALI
jgi:hypothetical protein